MPAAHSSTGLRIDAPSARAVVRALEPVVAELAVISADMDELAIQVARACGAHPSGHNFALAHARLSAEAVAGLDRAHVAIAGYADGLNRAVETLEDADSDAAASVAARVIR